MVVQKRWAGGAKQTCSTWLEIRRALMHTLSGSSPSSILDQFYEICLLQSVASARYSCTIDWLSLLLARTLPNLNLKVKATLIIGIWFRSHPFATDFLNNVGLHSFSFSLIISSYCLKDSLMETWMFKSLAVTGGLCKNLKLKDTTTIFKQLFFWMIGFEPWSTCVRSDHCVSNRTTTPTISINFKKWTEPFLSFTKCKDALAAINPVIENFSRRRWTTVPATW